jgi:integrase
VAIAVLRSFALLGQLPDDFVAESIGCVGHISTRSDHLQSVEKYDCWRAGARSLEKELYAITALAGVVRFEVRESGGEKREATLVGEGLRELSLDPAVDTSQQQAVWNANLGSMKELSEKAARRKLAAILEPINQAKCKPKTLMTFRGFIAKYRTLKLANKKGTTVHGYETNINAHFLPEFGNMQLSEITAESVQDFINLKAKEGKAVQTLKNLKWGLSSIFVAAVKYGYMESNPAPVAELPPKGVKERKKLPTGDQLSLLINALKEPISTLVYLMAVSSIRPEELAFKWIDLHPEDLNLWVVRAVNQGEIHTPKYHRSDRPIRLTEADVQRLLALKQRMKAQDDDWMFPNRIKKGKIMKPGPIWHETILGRRVQPVARRLGLPHITWRLLRHWGVTRMIRAKMELPAVQQRVGHSRPGILLEYHAEVLPPSADDAAETMSGQLAGVCAPVMMVNPVEV